MLPEGPDILARLQASLADVRPGFQLSYEPVAVEIALTGAMAPDPPGPPGPMCEVVVRVRDTRAGEILVYRSDDWPLGKTLDDPDPDGTIRDSFTWLLHALLDEWWQTEIRRT
ncbi:hypothetical protein MXD63_07485 [Frankia sp. Cpl3]|uniref:hypothetical protein n=1 Tax=Parafrankia colletiae TaxID=573497 RepID=UPI001042507B|nr:hypothetical protein [Parafrankia colletiae]MCK9899917.1 hypothetical protein [Frankia sp. Cpl3]